MNRQKLIERLRNRDFRRAFADEAVDVGIPIQIREMRLARGWSQAALGKEAGMAQEQVSLAEKLSYGRFSLATLKKLAAAFDCALLVRFAPFSELLAWKTRIDVADVTPAPFAGDTALDLMLLETRDTAFHATLSAATENVVDFTRYLSTQIHADGRRSPRKTFSSRKYSPGHGAKTDG